MVLTIMLTVAAVVTATVTRQCCNTKPLGVSRGGPPFNIPLFRQMTTRRTCGKDPF